MGVEWTGRGWSAEALGLGAELRPGSALIACGNLDETPSSSLSLSFLI